MSKLAHSNDTTADDIERIRAIDDGMFDTARVVKYTPSFSSAHPLSHAHLDAIGATYESASAKHGQYETWMAVYNECIRQGELAIAGK